MSVYVRVGVTSRQCVRGLGWHAGTSRSVNLEFIQIEDSLVKSAHKNLSPERGLEQISKQRPRKSLFSLLNPAVICSSDQSVPKALLTSRT